MTRLHKRWMDCKGLTMEEAENYARGLCEQHRDLLFHIGDLFRYSEAQWPDTHQQVWPENFSPDQLARCGGVCRAYPKQSDRATDVPFTTYRTEAGKPDRLRRIQDHADKGRTCDEAREHSRSVPAYERKHLAVFDLHYFANVHYWSGADVETAMQVANWVEKVVKELKRRHELTDVLCAFDSPISFRKALTANPLWDRKPYKDRPSKPSDLPSQLVLLRELMENLGFACLSVEGYEADDILASAAAQYPGKVTMVTADKDLNQCLDMLGHRRILKGMEWEDGEYGEGKYNLLWYDADDLYRDTGILPSQWADYQTIMGDNTDSVEGAIGIGTVGARKLIEKFWTADAAAAEAWEAEPDMKDKEARILMEFLPYMDVTRKLVTMVTDLELPTNTRV